MLIDAKLLHYLWEEALLHAAYVRNRVPSCNDTLTPHEKHFGSRPDASAWSTFGQAVVIHRSNAGRKKRWRFVGRGRVGAFVGFDEEVKDHHVYVPGRPGSRLRISADVRVLETLLHDVAVLPDDAAATPANGEGEEKTTSATKTATRTTRALPRRRNLATSVGREPPSTTTRWPTRPHKIEAAVCQTRYAGIPMHGGSHPRATERCGSAALTTVGGVGKPPSRLKWRPCGSTTPLT